MRMIRDSKGRFPERPYYTNDELDRECEQLVWDLHRRRNQDPRPHITTDELHLLIELNGASLDSCADLSIYGQDVEGVTAFHPGEDPEVSISDRLANDPRRENRLRTTLAHEFGHVHFHRHLWAGKFQHGQLFDRKSPENTAICKRDTILQAREYDWMEWQAGYVCGAILMPVTQIRLLVSNYCQELNLHAAVPVGSDNGRRIVNAVMETFQVSREAAEVRLKVLKLLGESDHQGSLFG
ncbi:ImmA/IrrE family metallo-endopeptidase [Parasphingorhabdus sp.]|uniref:ImmA/IrrE family metallo-endopeptidase n=1 Tax=Parasphingorhabdus sp. TaxID=2709688 RepID=UPI002F92938D